MSRAEVWGDGWEQGGYHDHGRAMVSVFRKPPCVSSTFWAFEARCSAAGNFFALLWCPILREDFVLHDFSSLHSLR